MTCDFALDDGAYVLGALSPAERSEFERHLSTCATCRESVASLAVLPGLLARLEPATAVALGGGVAVVQPAPSTLLPRTLAAAAQQRRFERRRNGRRRTGYLLATAAALVLLVTAAGSAVHIVDSRAETPIPMTAMRPAQQEWTPVSADLGMAATAGGTKLVMTCWYGSGYEDGWIVRLVVFPRGGGEPDQVGTWTADAGDTVKLTALTHLKPAEIARVELQRTDNVTLLWWTPT